MGICCKCGHRAAPDSTTLAERVGAQKRQRLLVQLQKRDSNDLLAIIRKRDEQEWRPEVFDVARELLVERGVDVAAALAAGTEEGPTQVVEGLVVVATLAIVIEAEACKAALAGSGIEALLLDNNMLGIDPALWPALGGVRVAVRSSDVEAARTLLAARGGA